MAFPTGNKSFRYWNPFFKIPSFPKIKSVHDKFHCLQVEVWNNCEFRRLDIFSTSFGQKTFFSFGAENSRNWQTRLNMHLSNQPQLKIYCNGRPMYVAKRETLVKTFILHFINFSFNPELFETFFKKWYSVSKIWQSIVKKKLLKGEIICLL